MHWIHENYRCPNCFTTPDNQCCKNVPAGQFCKADSVDFKDDQNVSVFCVKSSFHKRVLFRKMVDVNNLGSFLD